MVSNDNIIIPYSDSILFTLYFKHYHGVSPKKQGNTIVTYAFIGGSYGHHVIFSYFTAFDQTVKT